VPSVMKDTRLASCKTSGFLPEIISRFTMKHNLL
jgi:hypothetical protein